MNIRKTIKEKNLQHAFMEGTFGIEKEGLRITAQGDLALTDHPVEFGSRSYHPYIQTDFSESQIELVTPPLDSINETFDWLEAIHDVALRTISEEEVIWPYSMPAVLPPEEQIPIVKLEDPDEVKYRMLLAQKYGRKKQMISGIHYNFMFTADFMDQLFSDLSGENKKEAKEVFSLKVARNFFRYKWILTYLFGASPVALDCYGEDENGKSQDLSSPMRSLRNSPAGYPSSDHAAVSYDSYKEYVEDIEKLVETGVLEEEREYYGAVRLRSGKDVRDVLEKGLGYFEFRSFDVNPLSPLGITKDAADFIHYFLLYMAWKEESATHEEVKNGMKMNEHTAMEHPREISLYQEEGLEIIKEMQEMIQELGIGKDAERILDQASNQLLNPETSLSAVILDKIEASQSLLEMGIKLAEEYKEEAVLLPYRLRGFETMEMSTQLLIFDAMQQGIEVEVLDKMDQFLELRHGTHIEYVKNGNMTSKDTYISALLMGNKTTAKIVMREHGYVVPNGDEFQNVEEAVESFWKVKGKEIVVKPKSTNYGVGISVFKEPPSLDDYTEAITLAFQEDDAVLVEEFAHGTEYRFFVLNGKTEAVLLRIPANVKGDGHLTIRELVAEKNKDPYRGENHRAPLEKINLGELEKLMLHQQGYTEEDVPSKDELVYLRENSNVSTGGDSIDFTDSMHESYKTIAAGIAEVMGAKVCGVDLILTDHTQESTKDDPGYIALEANYNPAMHMHAFVYEGTGRRLTRKILEMLFPEVK